MPSTRTVLLGLATSLLLPACSAQPRTITTDRDVSDVQKTRALVEVGTMAPEFTIEMLDGTRIDSRDLHGQVVVLDFWTTWCLGCVQELPVMDEFSDLVDQQELPITVIAVNTHPNRDGEKHLAQVRSYLDQNGIELPIGLDPSGNPMAERFGVTAFPTNVIIDPEGRVAATNVGMKTGYIDWLMGQAHAAME